MTGAPQHAETQGRAKVPGLLLGPSLVLGIDTCGPSGSVALARLDAGGSLEILGQKELAGRSYSATLITAVGTLLQEASANLSQLIAIVIVNGPGSFTGVRVGVSATKGLAEGRDLGIVPVSRLEVLAAKAGADSAALDAHRHEIFLRAVEANINRELLAGKDELAAPDFTLTEIAVCDDAAAEMVRAAWPAIQIIRTAPPTAAEAIRHCAARIATKDFADVVLLDGHYLRRSDAEIFGETGVRAKSA